MRLKYWLVAILVAVAIVSLYLPNTHAVVNDFKVYREGAQVLLDHGSLYDDVLVGDGRGLPFTYPPFAAVLMIPTTFVSLNLASLGWLCVNMVMLFACGYLVARKMKDLSGGKLDWPGWVIAPILVGFWALLEPFTESFHFQQVNVLLMLLILLDSTTRPGPWTGILTGIAAGIKVVPGIFIVLMLATKRWADAARAIAALVATVLIGALFGVQNEIRFWTDAIFDTDRVGDLDHPSNAAINGVFQRLAPGSTVATIAWLLAAIAVGIAVMILAARWWRHDELTSVVVVALGGLLISPISWTHHWIWLRANDRRSTRFDCEGIQ